MPSVLIVDDDSELRALLVQSLSNAGYRTYEAAHGRQALDRLQTLSPDVLLVDVMMPVMNGVELIRALRADSNLQSIPVVLMTGVNDSMLGVRLNAPVVTKPNFDALMPILRQYVRPESWRPARERELPPRRAHHVVG